MFLILASATTTISEDEWTEQQMPPVGPNSPTATVFPAFEWQQNPLKGRVLGQSKVTVPQGFPWLGVMARMNVYIEEGGEFGTFKGDHVTAFVPRGQTVALPDPNGSFPTDWLPIPTHGTPYAAV